MPDYTLSKASDHAAVAFYGQDEKDFIEQVRRICAGDQRMMQIFKKTRERYLGGEFATS